MRNSGCAHLLMLLTSNGLGGRSICSESINLMAGEAATKVRAAEEHEITRLAEIWYHGWLDAHAEILPAELKRLRTLESFRLRLKGGKACSLLDSVGVEDVPKRLQQCYLVCSRSNSVGRV